MVPSPHTDLAGRRTSCPGTHEQPAPLILQSAEQPSPSVMLPSSQTSPSVDLHDAVAAARRAHARRAGRRADPALFQLAGGAAAVARRRVAVVAVLARLDALVAADRRSARRRCPACRCSGRSWTVQVALQPSPSVGVARRRTPRPGRSCRRRTMNDARARARRWAGPVRLDVADAVAAVAGDRVAVVALLDAALVVDAVAAARRNRQRAARCPSSSRRCRR